MTDLSINSKTQPYTNDTDKPVSPLSDDTNTDVTISIDTPSKVTSTHHMAPIKPIDITWRNIAFTVNKSKPHQTLLGKLKRHTPDQPSPTDTKPDIKHILCDISGYCLSGELLAIMGASGSGKTTLLNVLAGRNKLYTGNVLLNGKQHNKKLQHDISFIQQTDLFFKSLTVYEHLMFQARLRLPKTTTYEQCEQAVHDVIAELGLTKVTHNTIGVVGQNGISGGERRRLAVATELLTKPALLLLDEPTSGLDSFMAEEVIQILKQLTTSGRTVICTIHQPSSQLYAMFDRVMYLADGSTAYSGTVEQAVSYFCQLNYKCPEYTNAADYIIKQLSTAPSRVEESKQQINQILQSFEISSNHDNDLKLIDQVVARYSSSSDSPINTQNNNDTSDSHASWIRQFTVLLHRSALNIRRDPMLFKARMGQSIILGLLCGLIWLQLSDGQTQVQDRVGVLFFFILNQAMGNIMQMLNLFPLEMPVFAREYQGGFVRSDTYFLAKNLSELPFQVLFPIIFTTLAYWMVGLSTSASKWITITALNVLTSQTALSLGYTISAGSPSVQISLVLGPLLLMPFMIFGGLLINTKSIPDYFYWLSYTSFVKYGYEAMNIVLWQDTVINCAANEICTYHTGNDVLKMYGWENSQLAECVGALFALAIGLRFIAWLLLWRRVQKHA